VPVRVPTPALPHEKWFKKVSEKPNPSGPTWPSGSGVSMGGVNKIDLREPHKVGRRGCIEYGYTIGFEIQINRA